MNRALALLAHSRDRVESYPAPRVLAGFVVAQWAVVLGIAAAVRHSGWLYYQGGDQLWYYTSSWVLVHGHLPWPSVGYLWSTVMAPFAIVGGADLLSTLPGILVLNVVVLLPATLLALYGIANRIGGRVFAYWTLAVWIAVPLIGIPYTNTGYHQKYTELLLPQGLGLTAMADFPLMAATVISCYFAMRTLFDERPALLDGLAAGAAAGAVVGLKPSGAIFLVGPVLAYLATRRLRSASAFAAGMVPCLATVVLWKWRALGHVPITGAEGRHLGVASIVPVLAVHLRLPALSWSHLSHEFDLLREHFWSGRLIQWSVVAGTLGLARRSWRAVLLVAGWFGAYVVIKGTFVHASIEDGSLERLMIPSFPAFVLLLASIPLLVPGALRQLRPAAPAIPRAGSRLRLTLLVATVIGTALIPFAAIAAVAPERTSSLHEAVIQEPAVPINVDLGLRATQGPLGVLLSWHGQHPAGGNPFYVVYRAPGTQPLYYYCTVGRSSSRCLANITTVQVVTDGTSYLDKPPPGRWRYLIGVAANWLDDPHGGDVYFLSRPIVLTAP